MLRRLSCQDDTAVDNYSRLTYSQAAPRRTSRPGGPVGLTSTRGMRRWRKVLFLFLSHNAADPAAYFCLPVDRTVTMGSSVDL